MKDKKTEKMQSLQEEFNKIQENNKDFDANMLITQPEDLPDLGDMQIYDYEKDIQNAVETATDILDSLVDFFLGDLPSVIEHPYIKHKVMDDALNYADTLLLKKIAQKTIISQMRSIDNGNNGARDYEVLNQTMGQMRENAKFSDEKKMKLENYYMEFKNKLYLTKMASEAEVDKKEDAEVKKTGIIMDNRTINELIANAMSKENKDKR